MTAVLCAAIPLLMGWLTHPHNPVGWQRMALLLPLCLAISIVYKTIKCQKIREIPLAALALWVTVIIGMYAVGVGLLIIYELMA